MRAVRMGFVGCGTMGQLAHIANYARLPGVEMVAVAEPRRRLRAAVAERYGIARQYDNHLDLARDEEVEAVAAILPFSANAEVAVALLEAGKHVLVEKPMAVSADEARSMVAAAEKAGKYLMVGYMKRYDGGVAIAKELLQDLLQDGRCGDLTFARAHCFGGDWLCGIEKPLMTDEKPPRKEPNYPHWLPAEARGLWLTYINLYVHNINLLRYLLPTELQVRRAHITRRTGIIELDGGGFPAVLEAGSMLCHYWDEHTVLYLEKGRLEVHTPPPMLRNVPARVIFYDGATTPVRELQPAAAWDWAFRRQAEHFIQCIRDGTQPRSSGRDSLRDMEIFEQMFRRALETGEIEAS